MPLPEPSEQEGESVKAGQEPSRRARKPKESSNLVLARDKGGAKPTGAKPLEMSGPAPLSSNTPQISPAKKQGRIIHRKRSRVDAGEISLALLVLALDKAVVLHTPISISVSLDTPLFLQLSLLPQLYAEFSKLLKSVPLTQKHPLEPGLAWQLGA